MRLVFKWPKEKVRNVFLFSEVPPEWRKNLDMNGVNSRSKASPYAVTRQKGVKVKILSTLMFVAACLLWIFVGNYVAEYCERLKIGFPRWVNYLFLAIVILALCHFNDVFQNKNKDNDT